MQRVYIHNQIWLSVVIGVIIAAYPEISECFNAVSGLDFGVQLATAASSIWKVQRLDGMLPCALGAPSTYGLTPRAYQFRAWSLSIPTGYRTVEMILCRSRVETMPRVGKKGMIYNICVFSFSSVLFFFHFIATVYRSAVAIHLLQYSCGFIQL